MTAAIIIFLSGVLLLLVLWREIQRASDEMREDVEDQRFP